MTDTSVFPRFDLKTRIAVFVLLLFLACIWLLTLLTISRLQKEFSEVLASQQLASVDHMAAEIEQKVRLRFDSLGIVASEISPRILASPARLKVFLEQRPILASLFGNGIVVISAEGRGLASYPPNPERIGGNYRDTEYFSETLSSGKPTLGRPRIGRYSQKPGVAFAVPITDLHGKPLGVLAGLAYLGDATLFGQIANARVGKTGWLAVSDARHRVIVAINDPKRILQPFPVPGVNKMLDRYAAGEEGSGISINSQGREVLSSAKQIGKTGWFVQEVLPTDEAFAPLQSMKARAYGLAAGLSLLATLIVWLMIRALLAPLGRLSTEIRRMTEDPQVLCELPVARRDEIGELIVSFNRFFQQRRLLQEKLEYQARVDALTDLPNRRHFMETATQEIARATRFGNTLSILMLDVDHFKQINDRHGHESGDRVLRKLAEVCRATLREIDLVARLGGEEFAILLPQTDHNAALDAAERLRTALEAASVSLEQGLPLRFTVSIGVSTLADKESNIDMLLSQADKALYEAKRLGRNRVCCGSSKVGAGGTAIQA